MPLLGLIKRLILLLILAKGNYWLSQEGRITSSITGLPTAKGEIASESHGTEPMLCFLPLLLKVSCQRAIELKATLLPCLALE